MTVEVKVPEVFKYKNVIISDLGVFAPSECNVVHCSFVEHYFTTCFGLTGHLQVLWTKIVLLTVMQLSFLVLRLPLVIFWSCGLHVVAYGFV
jgi:hypothetical protein